MARVELILRKEVAGGGEGSSPTWLVKIKSSMVIVNVKALLTVYVEMTVIIVMMIVKVKALTRWWHCSRFVLR